jgi:hypothetical protein
MAGTLSARKCSRPTGSPRRARRTRPRCCGRGTEAQFRTDLEELPKNGWSLFGRAAGLEAQGEAAEVGQARAGYREA